MRRMRRRKIKGKKLELPIIKSKNFWKASSPAKAFIRKKRGIG
jgi:hypothetical protein